MGKGENWAIENVKKVKGKGMYSVVGEGVCCDFRWDEKDCRGIWTFGAGHRNLIQYTVIFSIILVLSYDLFGGVRKL